MNPPSLSLAAAVLAATLLAPAPARAECAADTNACAHSHDERLWAGVAQFRAGNRGAAHWAQADIVFTNRGKLPVVLVYRAGSGQLFDDQGNTYEAVTRNVRGIGVAEGSRVDTSFTLAPGESAPAQFEFRWHRGASERTGTRFQMSMAVREATPQAGGTVKLGREHLLRWMALADRPPGAAAQRPVVPPAAPAAAVAVAPALATAPAGAANPQAVPAEGDACGGRAGCRDFGRFAVEAVRLQPQAVKGAARPVFAEFRVRNTGAAPLVFGLVEGTGQLIDENGNAYKVGNSNVHVKGIGMVSRQRANPQFALRPGEARSFTLQLTGFGSFPMGRVFGADFALAELEPLPGNQLRTVREHAVGLPPLGVAAAGAAAAAAGIEDLKQAGRQLRELFRKGAENAPPAAGDPSRQ